jgi:hypothetical protein
LNGLEEALPGHIIEEGGLSAVAAGHDVIDRAWKLRHFPFSFPGLAQDGMLSRFATDPDLV